MLDSKPPCAIGEKITSPGEKLAHPLLGNGLCPRNWPRHNQEKPMRNILFAALLGCSFMSFPILSGCDGDKATTTKTETTTHSNGSQTQDKSKTTVDSNGNTKTEKEHKTTPAP